MTRVMRHPLAPVLFLAGAVLALALGCDADGLCMPPECDPTAPCSDDRTCWHGVCLYPCDLCPSSGQCRTDGEHRFCADADGLPVEPCPA